MSEQTKTPTVHPFPPLFDENSRILILGSFPSVKSREQKFFYGHPQNRFWKTLAGILAEPVPQTIEEKEDFLHRNHIALWDVIQSCEITGSSDSSIRNVKPNDLSPILKEADIQAIYCNGAKSYEYYVRYLEEQTGKKAEKLPSTSPANAAFSLEKLKENWRKICGPLKIAPAGIGETLLKWYDYHARILPWRSDPTPYHVWISEIMLQQTRVEAVKKYYDRWMEALPEIKDLAEVEEERLMKLWEGLGYYNRARNLKTAAITVMEEYKGKLPSDYDQLRSLKGIGEYTAGAIASIAFGMKEPAVDGNVLRVFSRLLAEDGDIGKQAVKKKITREVRRVLPAERPGDFNQALMDLGAGICLPKGQPLCEQCPWEAVCQARKKGQEQDFPVKAAKKARKIEKKTVLLLEIYGEETRRILLHKRPANGLLANLWELPNMEGWLDREDAREKIKEQWGHYPDEGEPLGKRKHVFSHIEWHMIGYRFRIRIEEEKIRKYRKEKSEEEKSRWALVKEEETKTDYAIPSAFAGYREKI